jgi:RHS repeat-associated protein
MQTLYSYDALGNLLCVEQHGDSPAGSHGDGTAGTGCSADPSNDPTSTWRVRRFTYDSFSRLLTAKNPEAGTITYAYDVDSNMISKTDARGITISYSPAALPIDELHRVRKKTYSNGDPAVTFTYDSAPGVTNAIGKLVSLTDPAGSASYSYDQLGRLSGESRMIFGSGSNQITKSLSYSYNLDGSLNSLTYPSGAIVTYTPDSAGRILSAVDSGHSISYATAATYQADGQMTAFVSGNAINNAFTYNKRLQPINMSAIAPSLPPPNQTVFSVGYNFHLGNGNNGNVYGITNYKDANRNQTFTYDPLNRLISAQNTGTDCNAITVNGKTKYWGNNYVYDAWGNLYQKNVTKCGAENLGITILNTNRIGTAGYGYDDAGNMTANATDAVNATFDAESRISTATKSGSTTTYVYDSDGNRVKKTNGSSYDTLYWYMTPGIVAESDLSGTTKSEYIFFNGERVARRDGVNGTGGVFYYFSDHLKTASVVTDATGNIKAESDYYPWGGELQLVNADSNHYKFTGKERDSETGLDYFGARYYSNGLGRWVSADWSATPVPVPYADYSNPQSLGLYGFVGGNPASKADPDGHCWPIGECAHNVMNAVDRAQAKLQAKAEATGIPAVAAATTFATGVTRDVVNGFVGLGTVGEASGAAWNGSTTERIVAAAEDGGKVGGIILTVVAVAGPKSTAPAGDTLKPGPHVGDGVPASGPRIKAAEQRAVNAEGAQNGCHTCGAQSPGTKSGNWVGDHQPATALNSSGAPQTLYPQCLSCMRRQGGQVTAAVRAGGGQQQTPKPVLPVPTKKPGEN